LSYCRWGVNSDLYVYGSDAGWNILGEIGNHIQILPTPAACRDRLIELRADGYKVPQRAIDMLETEANERK
jgi:hypothetical protein